MKLRNYLKYFFILVFLPVIFSACTSVSVKEQTVKEPQEVIEEKKSCFYSGPRENKSNGRLYKISDTSWHYHIDNDNSDYTLPDVWRNWWYTRLDGVLTDKATNIHVSNGGWPLYYPPVYSYDEHNWKRFSEKEVSNLSGYNWNFHKVFKNSTVWLARFYPYSVEDLHKYLLKIKSNPYVKLEHIGTSKYGRPICMITVSDFDKPARDKRRIWIHARTHPGETPPSFVIEGLVDYLTGGANEPEQALEKLIFNIVPMQNIDGVIAGNYRTTPDGLNLETMWYTTYYNIFGLHPAYTPVEVKVLHGTITRLIRKGPPFVMAINLHSANSKASMGTFFITHFGPIDYGYSYSEASLWGRQQRFASLVSFYHGHDVIETPIVDGGREFLYKDYPEKWWWLNFKDSVMAVTMEMTYGKSGRGRKWVTPHDFYSLGISTAKAIIAYNGFDAGEELPKNDSVKEPNEKPSVNYPELYFMADPVEE